MNTVFSVHHTVEYGLLYDEINGKINKNLESLSDKIKVQPTHWFVHTNLDVANLGIFIENGIDQEHLEDYVTLSISELDTTTPMHLRVNEDVVNWIREH